MPQSAALNFRLAVNLLILSGPRAGIHATGADLIDDTYFEVVYHAHLARQSHIFRETDLTRQSVALEGANFSGIAGQYLYATSCTLRQTAAAVKYINPGVLKGKRELLSLLGIEGLNSSRSLSVNYGHRNPLFYIVLELL